MLTTSSASSVTFAGLMLHPEIAALIYGYLKDDVDKLHKALEHQVPPNPAHLYMLENLLGDWRRKDECNRM